MTTSNIKILVAQNAEAKGPVLTADASQLPTGANFKVPQGANRIRVMLNNQALQGNEVIDGKKLKLKKNGKQLLIQAGDETLITLDDANNNQAVTRIFLGLFVLLNPY